MQGRIKPLRRNASGDCALRGCAATETNTLNPAKSKTLQEATEWYRNEVSKIAQVIDTSLPPSDQIAQAQKMNLTLLKNVSSSLYDTSLFTRFLQQAGLNPAIVHGKSFSASLQTLRGQEKYKALDGKARDGQELDQVILDDLLNIKLDKLNYEPACFAAGTLVHTKEGLKPIETIQVGDWVLSKHESGEGEREYKRVTRTFVHEEREVNMLSIGWRQPDGELYFCRLAVTPEHPIWVRGKKWKAAEKLRNTSPTTYVESLLSDEAQVVRNVCLFATEQPGVAWRPTSHTAYDLSSVGSFIEFKTFRYLGAAPPPMKHPRSVVDLRGALNTRSEPPLKRRARSECLYRTTVYNFEVEDFHTYYVGEAGVWVHNKGVGNVKQVISPDGQGVVPANPGYLLGEGEVRSFFSAKEAYGYLRRMEQEVIDANQGKTEDELTKILEQKLGGIYAVKASEPHQSLKDFVDSLGGNTKVSIKDYERWQHFEEYAPGKIEGPDHERFEYILAYYDKLFDGQQTRFLSIEGRLDGTTFVDQKLQLLKGDDYEGLVQLLYRTSLVLKSSPNEVKKIQYQFNDQKAMKKAEDDLADIRDGRKIFENDDPFFLEKLKAVQKFLDEEPGKIETTLAPSQYRIPQTVFAQGEGLGVEALPMAAVEALWPTARQYWLEAGASPDLLAAAHFAIDALPDGMAACTEGLTITLDEAGAGWGWYVDGTPGQNEDFDPVPNAREYQARSGTAAEGRLDLLTVMIHELGHVLGLAHSADTRDEMAATITPGLRRLPDLDATEIGAIGFGQVVTTGLTAVHTLAVAAPQYATVANLRLTNAEFNGSQGWATTGQVQFAGGSATLQEGAESQTRLNQVFVINEGERYLSFDLTGFRVGLAAQNSQITIRNLHLGAPKKSRCGFPRRLYKATSEEGISTSAWDQS